MKPGQNEPHIAQLLAQSPSIRLFLVGGCVRDELLGIPSSDRDWVVVGARPEQMRAAGFKSVGKDFPVFIHPISGEEYALARQERKVGPGYQGFAFDTGKKVTLEQDLMRRDFTINAIAQDPSGTIIDPLNGVEDIRQRKIKHVSNAFTEDPLRVLRAARFAAKFYPLGFSLADSTLDCLKEMAESNELSALTPERVWLETEKALNTQAPWVYFQLLFQINAMPILFPELDNLVKINSSTTSDQNCTPVAAYDLNAIEAATTLSSDPEVRFAALLQNLESPTIAKQGERPIQSLCHRLKVPKHYLTLAERVSKYHLDCDHILESSSDQVFALLKRLDAFRNPTMFDWFLTSSKAIAHSKRTHTPEDKLGDHYPQAKFLRNALQACQSVSAQPFIQKMQWRCFSHHIRCPIRKLNHCWACRVRRFG